MRQTVRFDAIGFQCSPVEVEVPEGVEPPEEEALPVAVLVFESGGVALTVPIGQDDAESLMNAFTEAEPMRGQIPEHGWEPQVAALPGGMLWALMPTVVGVSVTPPHDTPEGIVPFWTLVFDDEEGSQVQVAVTDAMCVQVVRALAGLAHGEPPPPAS